MERDRERTAPGSGIAGAECGLRSRKDGIGSTECGSESRSGGIAGAECGLRSRKGDIRTDGNGRNAGELPISDRLKMNAALVPRCETLADVGCDHAYTAIYLAAAGRAGRCIAMDVAAGPLARAEENIRRYGLEGRIETRRSDGLAGLRPGEADVIMIGGMGGPLMLDILRRGLACVRAARALVLQPQSEPEEFRRGLRQLSLAVLAEDMCCEGGKYYTAIYAENAEQGLTGGCEQEETAEQGLTNGCARKETAERGLTDGCEWEKTAEQGLTGGCERKTAEQGLTGGCERKETPECGPENAPADGLPAWLSERYGPCLIAGRHPVLREFLQRELQKKEELAARLAGQATEKSRERQKALTEELQEISRLLELF